MPIKYLPPLSNNEVVYTFAQVCFCFDLDHEEVTHLNTIMAWKMRGNSKCRFYVDKMQHVLS